MNNLRQTNPPPPRIPTTIILDEFGWHNVNDDDKLKVELRKIAGVANASYLVRDGKVFVFAKLVELVKESRNHKDDAALPLEDLALSLITLATVSAKEAVDRWDIVPTPYEMGVNRVGGFMIRHRPFNACLPGNFLTKRDVQDAFANLLLGGVQPGIGDFTYRGQSMLLCQPLNVEMLPAQPIIEGVIESDGSVYTTLGSESYEPGFDLVSELLFDQVKALESIWANTRDHAMQHAQAYASDIWKQAAFLRLETLDDSTNEVPDYWQHESSELRALYPELSMLSAGSLYAWFDTYQCECNYIYGWTPTRDDGFLFYLLGNIVDRQQQNEASSERGKLVAYSLLRCNSLDEAIEFSRAAGLYDSAITRFSNRIASAMSFLAKDKIASNLRGSPIRTFGEMNDVFSGNSTVLHFHAIRKPE